ncbi:HipA domain-containing protein [Halomonas sp. HNIBRBA4712]|uniref:HipA domain-containing protein n=1 Tax=Halomonas sp. HNIBRBA4712 TaxID=3373087 RepID=UPI0037461B91
MVGLPCPATFVRHTRKHALLIVERFDRGNANWQHVRIHQEDLCQAPGPCPHTSHASIQQRRVRTPTRLG